MVPLKMLDLDLLIKFCHVGGAYLIHSPFRSGKTTHLHGVIMALWSEYSIVR
jgi:hypothetical protein